MLQKLLPFLLLSAATQIHAQYQDHIWYFGNSTAGLNFNAANVPSGLSNKYTPFGAEGCFVATNPNTGELMFYTSGNRIINKNHALMQNGNLVFPAPAPIVQPNNGIFNSSVNGAQSVAVIEKPNSVANNECGKFLYFINDANEYGASGKPGSLYIGEIDMNANAGLGSVTQQPVRIISNAFTESMLVIARPDNQGAWILLNNVLTNRLEVYAVTVSGTINTTPVSTFVVPGANWPVTWGTQNAAQSRQLIGSMAYSQPTGKIAMAQSYANRYELYIGDFNSTTGALSNVTLRETFGAPNQFTAYGTEFSPSGNWLYNSIASNSVGAGAIRAYNMQTSTDIGNINGAGGWPDLLYNGLKAGPDGRLWVNTNNYGTDPTPARVVRSTFNIENPVALGFVSFTIPVNSFSYRFPDFLSLIPPPIVLDDQEVIVNCTHATTTTTVLTNDTNSGAGNLFVDRIVDTPVYGTAVLTGNQIIYTLNDLTFVGTDTVSYLVKSDVGCLAPGKISRLLVQVTQCPRDYGDAPNSYSTEIAANGASHNVVPGLNLGTLAPDIDINGSSSASSTGDDLTGIDDEDGVSSFPVITGGASSSITNYSVPVGVTNNTGIPANLCGWIDWNNDGVFDSSEGVCTSVSNGATAASLVWPSATVSGPGGTAGTFARFRITTDVLNSATPNGVDSNGEVEDYFIPFQQPLPVAFTFFNATKSESAAWLEWQTASERNNRGFYIEHSADGFTWDGTLNFTPSKAEHGNSDQAITYSYTHQYPQAGSNYYRLKQVDADLRHAYSEIRKVDFTSPSVIHAYPNPVKETVYLSGLSGNELIKITDITGRIILSQGSANIALKEMSVKSLECGIYFMTVINSEGAKCTFKLIKE